MQAPFPGGLLSLLLAAFLVTAGCLGSDPSGAGSSLGPTATDGGNWSEHSPGFTLELRDLPRGSDYVLVEAVSPDSQRLRGTLEVDASLPRGADGGEQPDGVCAGAWVSAAGRPRVIAEGSGFPFTGSDLTARAAGSQVEAGAGSGIGVDGIHAIVADVQAETHIPILLAVGDGDRWKHEGWTAKLTVEAEEPIRWRIADVGEVRCGFDVTDLDGGTIARSEAAMLASDLSLDLSEDEPGYLYIEGATTGAVDVAVRNASGEVWGEAWMQGAEDAVGVHAFNATIAPLPPGERRLELATLAGSYPTGIRYFWMQVPAWAEDVLHPERILSSDGRDEGLDPAH